MATESGQLHIVMRGGAVTGGTEQITLPAVTMSTLTGVFTPFKTPTLPSPGVSLTGTVYHSVITIQFPTLLATIAGEDYHSVLNVILPDLLTSVSGAPGHLGSLSVPLSKNLMLTRDRWVLDEADEWDTEEEEFDWFSGQLRIQWKTKLASAGWKIMSFSQIQINHLSTEYILVPVQATKAGNAYNPTSDTVQFAFMTTPTQVPQVSDWVSGSWDTDSSNFLYPYSAKCLVGPSGTITLTVGTYVIYVKIQDNPEIPVLTAGQLIVT